ncbi:MAG: hypothetical protein F9K40_11745 [Kofleriaceae bacterium]|nr:MAG: hypothetical protein F9K40_11745 [Kofleriaceae bacterium]MBZ0234919.1 hypothetical protein [Kofleriaceae bacterium]
MLARSATPVNQNDIAHYFEYSRSGLQVIEDGLKEIPFGEFMVERGLVDRVQLFRALQMQDRYPGVRIGECAAALGYVQIGEVERLYDVWRGVTTVEIS